MPVPSAGQEARRSPTGRQKALPAPRNLRPSFLELLPELEPSLMRALQVRRCARSPCTPPPRAVPPAADAQKLTTLPAAAERGWASRPAACSVPGQAPRLPLTAPRRLRCRGPGSNPRPCAGRAPSRGAAPQMWRGAAHRRILPAAPPALRAQPRAGHSPGRGTEPVSAGAGGSSAGFPPAADRDRYEDRPRELGLCRSEKRRLRGDLNTSFPHLEGACRKDGEGLF